jgi:outer membrane immunogenic protein
MVYSTGGLAWGNNEIGFGATANNGFAAGITQSNTHVGWTVGGGVEWMFAPRWSVKAEYLYYDLGSRDLDLAFTVHDNNSNRNATFNSHTNVDFKGSIARVGVNYHFGGGLY